jgi:hypothetical protein
MQIKEPQPPSLTPRGVGSYTFAKTLEYKAKQNLKSGKEVTVIPPNEYQARFVNAMDGYFLACPGRSKPTSGAWEEILTIIQTSGREFRMTSATTATSTYFEVCFENRTVTMR